MKHISFFAGTLLVAAPLALLISGCGGGNGGGLLGGQTATPTATSTATPITTQTTTPTSSAVQTSNFTLGNSQRAILKTTTNGTALSGTIQILAPSSDARRSTKALNFAIKIGTYAISGTFTPPRGYNFIITDGGQTLFSMNGLLPTATQTGTYTLIANGQTETGVIPIVGTPFPTAMPSSTATPIPTTPGTGGFVSNLTFTPSSGSNFVNAPFTSANFTFISVANTVGAAAQSNIGVGKDGVFLVLGGVKATVGTSTTVDNIFGVAGYIYNYLPSGQIKGFLPESGTVTLVAISQNSMTVRFNNVVYAANTGSAATATGKVTVSGTLTGPLKRL